MIARKLLFNYLNVILLLPSILLLTFSYFCKQLFP